MCERERESEREREDGDEKAEYSRIQFENFTKYLAASSRPPISIHYRAASNLFWYLPSLAVTRCASFTILVQAAVMQLWPGRTPWA